MYLGWVKEPEQLKGLTTVRPDPALAPQVVGQYNKTPPGGRRRNPNGPWIFCAHCQARTHWQGFVLATGHGQFCLIGSKCGPEHYGADRFTVARREYQTIEERQNLLARGKLIVSFLSAARIEVECLLNSRQLKAVEFAGAELRRGSPDLQLRLASNILTGDPLKVQEPVRGAKGKTELALRSIGQLLGTAVVSCSIRQDAADFLYKGQELENIPEDEWQSRDTKSLLKSVRDVERSAKQLLEARLLANKAYQFFGRTNRSRLARWVAPLHRFLSLDLGGEQAILVSDARVRAGPVEIQPIPKADLPKLSHIGKIAATV